MKKSIIMLYYIILFSNQYNQNIFVSVIKKTMGFSVEYLFHVSSTYTEMLYSSNIAYGTPYNLMKKYKYNPIGVRLIKIMNDAFVVNQKSNTLTQIIEIEMNNSITLELRNDFWFLFGILDFKNTHENFTDDVYVFIY